MTVVYEGLTGRQKLFVVGSAIVAVLLSLAFAAWIMGDTLRSTQFSQQDQEVVNRLSGDTADPLHKSILRAHAIDAVANLKQLANRQSIVIVAFAGAFALCAVGFALILLGADSVFQLQAGQGKSGLKPWLAGTAPGILCFVLAMILAGMAVVHRSSVNLASVNFPKQIEGVAENSVPRSPAAAEDTASKVEAQKAKEAAEQRNAEREAQNRATEKAAAEKLAVEKAAVDKLAVEKAAADKLAVEKAAADKLAAEKAAADKLAPEIAAAEKSITDKRAMQKAAAAKKAAEKAAAAKLAAQKAADTKLSVSKAFVAKLEADRVNAAKLAADRDAADKLAADKTRADKAAADRLASNKAAKDTARPDTTAAGRIDVASLTAERIAAAGTPSEIYKRALVLRNEGETSRAVALLRYASSTGHGPSSRLLAAIYRDGAPGVRANFREVERFQGLADAQGER